MEMRVALPTLGGPARCEICTHKEGEGEGERQRQRQTDTQTHTHTHRQTDRKTGIEGGEGGRGRRS
eukprot:356492-Hanusia_phi.AAC.1